MVDIEYIFEMISKYIGVSEVEKKMLGEVFTPFKLINEMLDTLPAEVWTNPNLKWLDPAAGIGNFPAIIIKRLMVGLKDFEPNAENRYKWILEKMIYICDIQPKNLFIFYNLFDQKNEYKTNVYSKSFLEKGFDEWMEGLGIKGFDIVVGNPPYQSSTKDKNGANSLWIKFVEKSNIILNKFGYLLLIAGDSWLGNELDYEENGRMTITKIRSRIFKKNDLIFVKFGKSLNEYFPNISIDFCYFLMKKYKTKLKTNIYNDYGNFNYFYDDLYFIPKYNINICYSIMNKTILKNIHKIEYLEKEKNFISDKRKWKGNFSLEKTDKHIYPSCNTSSQSNKKQYIWSNIKDKNQETKKVIFSDSGYLSPFYDKGEFGLNSHSFGIKVNNEDESNTIILYLNSNIVLFLSKCFPASGFENQVVKIFQLMPLIDLSKSWTNEELYQYFNLTQNEIDLIEKTIK